ncbi:MAG TPA: GNAT family N-acetyltransferase [Clostridia bacterium]|nr:GNAT family N-acetyltransferase [Clostridia bacterium]HPQ47180.1 GNAT family N-acetyltransferase [Clostridia bacterium]
MIIKRLGPDLVEDYLRFFDTEDHSDNIPEHKCYCVCWSSDDHRAGTEMMSTAEKRRTLARKYIENGMIKGYLAYEDDRVVGWCNANEKTSCRNCISWLRLMGSVENDTTKSIKVLSVFCFAIATDMRRRGIATKLLSHVCSESIREGYDVIEAYPRKNLKGADDFEGPLSMFLKCGFTIYKELPEMFLVRKSLV